MLLAGRDVPAACKIALSVAPYSFLRGAAPVLPDRGAIALGPGTILSFLEPVPGIAPSALGGEPGKLATPHVMNTRVNIILSRMRVALPPTYEERWLAAITSARNTELGLLDGAAGIPADARVTSVVTSRALLARAHNELHTVAETRVPLDVELGRAGAFLVAASGGSLVLAGVPVAPGLVLSFLIEYTVTEESIDAAAARSKVLAGGSKGQKGAATKTATYVIAVGDAMPCTTDRAPAQGGAAATAPARARFRLGKNPLRETERPWQVRLAPPFPVLSTGGRGGSVAMSSSVPAPPAHGPDAVPWVNANGGGLDALLANGELGGYAGSVGASVGAADDLSFFVGGELSVRLPVAKPVVMRETAVTPARGGGGALLSPAAKLPQKSAVSFASAATEKAVKENSVPAVLGGAAAAAQRLRQEDESDGSDGSSDFSDSEIGSFHSPTSRVSDVLSPSPPPRPAVVRDAQEVRAAAERAEPIAPARPPLSKKDGGPSHSDLSTSSSNLFSSFHGGQTNALSSSSLSLNVQPPAPVERIDSLLGAVLDMKVSALTTPIPTPTLASASVDAPPPILSSDTLALFTNAAAAGSLRASAARGRTWSGVGAEAAEISPAATTGTAIASPPVTRTFSGGLTPLHGLPLPLRDAARLASFGLPIDVKAIGVDAPAPTPDASVEASDPRSAHVVTILFAAFVPNAARASAPKKPASTLRAAADNGAIEPRATAAVSSRADDADDAENDASDGVPHSISIGCQFYTAPYVRVGPAQLEPPRGAPSGSGRPAPAEQHLLVNVPRGVALPEKRGPGTFPSICVRVDPSAAPPAERTAFASYLCNGDLQVDVWDGDSLLPLGTATIALSVRLRIIFAVKRCESRAENINPHHTHTHTHTHTLPSLSTRRLLPVNRRAQ